MKNINRFFAVAAALLLCICAHAQKDFRPVTSWTYLFLDFTDGTAYAKDGTTYATEKMNITVPEGRLRFIQDGMIKEVEPGDVDRVEIGAYSFMNVMGHLYQVAAKSDKAAVLYDYPVNQTDMEGTDVGFGIKSSTVSASNHEMNQYGVITGSTGTDTNKVEYEQALKERSSGSNLPVSKTTYIYAGKRLMQANENTVLLMSGVDKKALKDYVKSAKLKWSKPEDLLKIGDWLAGQL